MNWGFNPNLLKRVVNTPHQTRLKRVDREKNIQNAFEFVSRHSLTSDHGTPIVLFDDVYTTGTTTKEAAKVLKKAGYKNIYGLVIAS
ncbi:MAG: ComF family protein [uncultured bacterium]|nr:MAG: ComF family protein [uncultured bacterium]